MGAKSDVLRVVDRERLHDHLQACNKQRSWQRSCSLHCCPGHVWGVVQVATHTQQGNAHAARPFSAHLWAGKLLEQRTALQLGCLKEQQAAEGAQRAGGAPQLLQRQQLLAHRRLQLG